MSTVRDIHRGRVVHLTIEEVTLPNGHVMPLEIVRHPGAAAVVAMDEQGNVTLIRQYRHAVGGYLWEIPAGKLEPDETPLTCATRELAEEVGLQAATLEPIGSIVTCPGFCDEVIHLFLATSLSRVPMQRGVDEVIESVSAVPLASALAMIRTGAIRDSKTIAGLVQTSLRSETAASGSS
jgi:ADP-ribose pyrophosphatase